MPTRAAHPVGSVSARARNSTTRRGTPLQDRSPFALWRTVTAVTAVSSQGHPPAHSRHAILTREYQRGGAPTRSTSTRRGHHQSRPPPAPPTHRRTSLPRRPIITTPGQTPQGRRPASLSRPAPPALDPPARARNPAATMAEKTLGGARKPSPPPRKPGHTTATPYSHLTGPFHISAVTRNVRRAAPGPDDDRRRSWSPH